MKQQIHVFCFVIAVLVSTSAYGQFSSVKTNLLGLVTTNLNVGMDIKVTPTKTINIPVSGSPFNFGKYAIRYITVQPGLRFWLYENYIGHFLSGYLVGAKFNTTVNDIDRDGWAAGIGASYGYSWLLSTRWSLECEMGLALLYNRYDQNKRGWGIFERETIEKHRRWMIAPTKMCVSFSYLF